MATNLEEAAHGAVQAVRALVQVVQGSREKCVESTAEVGSFSQRLESDRADLNKALSALEQTLADLGQKVPPQATETVSALLTLAQGAGALGPPSALDQIYSNVPGLAGSATEVLDAESVALGVLAERLRATGAALEPLAAAAESASRAALEQAAAIEESLRQAVDEAEQLVSIQLATGLGEVATAVDARADQVESFLSGACTVLLTDKEEDWIEKRGAAQQVLDQAFLDMKDHAQALAAEALEDCRARVGEAVEGAATRIAGLETELRELNSVVTDSDGAVQDAASLVRRLQAAARSAHAVAAAVDATRQRWCGYGFGC